MVKREPLCLQPSLFGHLLQSKITVVGKKIWRNPCGFGRCFPSESLLHNTEAEGWAKAEWVSLAPAKIKPCSNLNYRGEKWRLCVSGAGIINFTFLNSVVPLVHDPQRTWNSNKAGFQDYESCGLSPGLRFWRPLFHYRLYHQLSGLGKMTFLPWGPTFPLFKMIIRLHFLVWFLNLGF